MNKKNNQKVTSVNGRLQAIWMESMLEQAGIPVNVCKSKNGSYLDICVPGSFAYDAKNILNPEFKRNQISFSSVSI